MNRAARIVGTIVMAAAITVSNFVVAPSGTQAATTTFESELKALIVEFRPDRADNLVKKYIDNDSTGVFCTGKTWEDQAVKGMLCNYFTFNKFKEYNFASCILLDLSTLKNASNPKSKYSIFFYYLDQRGQKKTFSYKLPGIKTKGLGFYACLKLTQRQALLSLIKNDPERVLGTSLIEELNGKTVYYDCFFFGRLLYNEMFGYFGVNGRGFPRSQQDTNNFYFDLVYMGTPKVSQGGVGLKFSCKEKQTYLITLFDGRADRFCISLKTEIGKEYIAKNLGADFTGIDVMLYATDGVNGGIELDLGTLDSMCEWFFEDLTDPEFDEVKILTEIFFEAKVEKFSGYALVDFYGPECEPCEKMLPHLQRLAIKQSVVKIYRMDATQSPKIAQKYKVTSWPHLILFLNGQPVDELMGYRTYDDLKDFIKFDDYIPPPPLEELDDSNFGTMLNKPSFYFLAFFYDDSDACTQMIKDLEKINQRSARVVAGQMKFASNRKTTAKYKITKAPCLVMFLGGKEVTRTSQILDYDQLKDLLKNNGCKT